MNEAKFRSQLDALGRKYQDHIRDMNSVDSPGFKKKHQQLAQAVISEISALEKKREAAKAYDYIRARGRFMAQSHEPMVVTDPEIVATWDGLPIDGVPSKWAGLSDGKTVQIQTNVDEPETLTWIDYHDRLSKEWAVGELALIDDLYPDPPEKAVHRSLRSRCNPFVVGATVLCISITAVLVLLVWLAKMLIGF